VDAEDVRDDDWLLRRIPPWHLPQESQGEQEHGAPAMRPPSSAFSLDRGETGLSFHLESSLRAAGEGLTYGCPEGEPGWAVTRIAASEIRRLGLRILRDDKPHHLQVFGLAELRGTALRRMQRDIARRSAYVIPPRIG
jgi:hypothetical protein